MMKMKNKIAAVSTAAILTLSIAGNVFAADTSFKDLGNVNAKDKIIALQNKGLFSGTAEGVFSPYSTITAAQSIQLFVRAFNLNLDTIRFVKEPKATDYFKKAKNNSWYAQALIIGAVNGLDFSADIDPDLKLTREEYTYHLIKAIEKYGQLPMIKLVPVEIADQDQMTIEYSGAIQRALKYGIVKLDKEGRYNPKGELTRAEAAEQLYIALEYLKAHSAPVVTQP
ncbi:MAG TPA: S-layer homology domain-containing protein [Clostridia bacterium]|nr:S-layer homology domain-containing protein [Clostridia bacterium]